MVWLTSTKMLITGAIKLSHWLELKVIDWGPGALKFSQTVSNPVILHWNCLSFICKGALRTGGAAVSTISWNPTCWIHEFLAPWAVYWQPINQWFHALGFSSLIWCDTKVFEGWLAGCKCLNFPIVNTLFTEEQNVHAVGDRANGIVLDAFEESLKDVDVVSLRPRLEHAQMMTKSDMKRLGRLGGEHTSDVQSMVCAYGL